jgi:crotonobetainyl-CoA:carnitine CoA-transferase CaiB-like acyl-CoA transferase
MTRFEKMEGIRAVELCRGHGAAALAGKFMADLGVRVAKVEPSCGDPARAERADGPSLFDLVSGTKDSVALNLDDPKSSEPLRALLADADFLIADQKGHDDLKRLFGADFKFGYPKLTVCLCTPFGAQGTMSGWVGGEEIVQAMSGIMATTGALGGEPTRLASATITHATAMAAVSAMLGDLLRKQGGAEGGVVEACLFDNAIALQTAAIPSYFLEGIAPRGIGNRHTMAAPWNSFACSDGWIIICAGNAPTWTRLCQAIGRSDLLENPLYATQQDRVTHVDVLEAELTQWTRRHTVQEAEELLDRHGIPAAPVLPLADVLRHGQFTDRSMLLRSGPTVLAGGIFHVGGEPLRTVRGRSNLGEATRPALSRIVSGETYRRWVADGVVMEANGKSDERAA